MPAVQALPHESGAGIVSPGLVPTVLKHTDVPAFASSDREISSENTINEQIVWAFSRAKSRQS